MGLLSLYLHPDICKQTKLRSSHTHIIGPSFNCMKCVSQPLHPSSVSVEVLPERKSNIIFGCLEDAEAVSSSYESYDEEEVTRGKSPSAQHQWPSAEASIELMKDARLCAFLWRKKWLGQWAKQLCVIKDHRLLVRYAGMVFGVLALDVNHRLGFLISHALCTLQCYKSSKEQTPQLDVNLLGCSVVHKEKHLKRKEHKLKILPVGGEAIVLALQSKEQTELWLRVKRRQNWLKGRFFQTQRPDFSFSVVALTLLALLFVYQVIQEISPRPLENCDPHSVSDSPRLICTKVTFPLHCGEP